GVPLHRGVKADVDRSASGTALLAEIVAAARTAGRPARVHLKIDTGLNRGGAKPADWAALVEAAAKAQADGWVEVVGVWSHFATADEPGHPAIDGQLEVFREGLATAGQLGVTPTYRHI